MVSTMARQDMEALKAKGVELTFEQIVELNALALRVERNADAAVFCHAPRTARAGNDVILYEPSIQAQMWLRDNAMVWWHGKSLEAAVAWACVHSIEARFFDDKTDEKACRKAIEKWFKTLPCTAAQLDAALDYVVNGVPDGAPAVCPGVAKEREAEGCPYTEVVNEALAAGLGLTLDEILTRPRRVIEDIYLKWLRNQIALAGGSLKNLNGGKSTDAYVKYDDYLQALTPEAPE